MAAGIVFFPGRGKSHTEGLGQRLRENGLAVSGVPMVPSFLQQPFAGQLREVLLMLEQGFWTSGARVVGQSYGAYVLLHALAGAEPFPGRILLLSPVLGAARMARGGLLQGSIPPRSDVLRNLAETGAFPSPAYLELHTGAEDNGCCPELAETFAGSIADARFVLCPGKGHGLGSDYELDTALRFAMA